MKILVSGSTGLVGSDLVSLLESKGHEVVRLVRNLSGSGDAEILWDPANEQLDETKLDGFDTVVHLSGENVSTGRWTEKKKKIIRDSRIKSTQLLVKQLLKIPSPPKTFICASAIGYFGNRYVTPLNEDASPGTGFLAQVCQEWEKATEPLSQKGIRVINLRIGVVLSSKGGALKLMLTPFKLGIGGKIGSGKQYFSWVSLADMVGIIAHTITNTSIDGPVNAVSPHPLTNHEFTKALGKVLHRPTLFPVPAFMAKIIFGEMAQELLLASLRVEPKKLEESGYQFRHPNIHTALASILK